jgi:hypothetical protein
MNIITKDIHECVWGARCGSAVLYCMLCMHPSIVCVRGQDENCFLYEITSKTAILVEGSVVLLALSSDVM